MKKILYVDDDQIAHKLVEHVTKDEFYLSSCYSLKEAENLLKETSDFSVILIDRQLPDGDGLSLCTFLRSQPHLSQIPIIFISGMIQESDKVTGLFAGADDYVAKPIPLLELKARVMARMRTKTNTLFHGKLEIDQAAYRAFCRINNESKEIQLTRTEFKILALLANSNGSVFSREQLLNKVWGQDCFVNDRVIDTHISHLRKKISTTGMTIESLRGEGYRLSSIDQEDLKQVA